MDKETPPRYKLIACEILIHEVRYCVAHCRNTLDVEFLPQGLHDVGERQMANRLQAAIDAAELDRYDAILLGYGLCNNGLRGLHAGRPLVAPRAHDCITLLLGSKEKYADYFRNNPGTYFKSPGWIECAGNVEQNNAGRLSQLGLGQTYQAYAQKYGEDNARYLMETIGDELKNYKKLAYIDTGTGDFSAYQAQTQQTARERGWEYERVPGNVDLLLRLMNGKWNPKDFLVVTPPGAIQPTYEDDIITAK